MQFGTGSVPCPQKMVAIIIIISFQLLSVKIGRHKPTKYILAFSLKVYCCLRQSAKKKNLTDVR